MKRLRIFVYGKVQGVFFRANTRKKAKRLGIKGWVRNRKDGSVEILAEGKKEKIKELIGWARSGPPAARVEKIEKNKEKIKKEFRDFKIRY